MKDFNCVESRNQSLLKDRLPPNCVLPTILEDEESDRNVNVSMELEGFPENFYECLKQE